MGRDALVYAICDTSPSCRTGYVRIDVVLACTIVSTDYGDYLDGTDGDDVICGLGGMDIISGRGGDDLIFGGDGDDAIDGGLGDDVLIGEDGVDWLVGGDGNDVLEGRPGSDVLVGGAGADQLDGGDDDDSVPGGDGGDDLQGGAADDELSGQAGADRMIGGPLAVGFVVDLDATDLRIGALMRRAGHDPPEIETRNAERQAVEVVESADKQGHKGRNADQHALHGLRHHADFPSRCPGPRQPLGSGESAARCKDP